MIKNDDINTFLLTEPNIKSDYEFLLNYINTFLYKNLNREKIDDFYKRIPALFDRVFGISSKTRAIKTSQKTSSSEVDMLNSGKTTLEDFDSLLHLLMPGLENLPSFKLRNLFYSLNSPPDYVPHYTIPTAIVSRSINSLINQKKQDYVLSLEIFSILSKNIETQRQELEKGLLHLNIFEYFVVMLLIVIKEYPSGVKHKVTLSKMNKNFDSGSSMATKGLSEKTKEIMFSLDHNRSPVCNFFSILFKSLLNYFANSRYINDMMKLRLMVTAIELIWLSDYFMIPSSSYVTKSPYEIYSYFFKSSGTNFPGGNGFYMYDNVNVLTTSTPNVILLECLYNVIVTLQSGNLLFRDNTYNANIEYSGNGYSKNNTNMSFTLEKDALLFLLQKPLFYFFKTSFMKFSEGSSSSSEVNLSDVARLWFCYITPWMGNFNCSQNYNSGSSGNTKLNDLDEVIREYIFMNLLFYTELFNDYIVAFSSLNVLNKNELSLLNKVLDLFKIREDEIINDFVNLKVLEDLSTGKVYNYSSLIEVDHHVKYIGSSKKNLYPFSSNDNRKFARSIVNNISNWVYKLEKDMNDEIRNFMNTLKESQNILKSLYSIGDEMNYLEQSNQKNFLQDENNLHLRRNYEAVTQGNHWNRRMSSEENFILFHLFKYVSYCVDYFKGIPIRYDRRGNMEPPITNLRFLANYYNLGSAIIFILIIYVLVKLVVNLMTR